MSNKERFSFLLRPEERADLQRLAAEVDRSQGATLRLLIRQAAREQCGPRTPESRSEGERHEPVPAP